MAKTLHPYCDTCGWRKGGQDSWDGHACRRCGHSAPALNPCRTCDGTGYVATATSDPCPHCHGSGIA